MKIALCQFNIRYEEKKENLVRAEAFIHQAASNQADMILFPEMSFTGFSMYTDDVADYRKEFPVKADRRPSLYKEFY